MLQILLKHFRQQLIHTFFVVCHVQYSIQYSPPNLILITKLLMHIFQKYASKVISVSQNTMNLIPVSHCNSISIVFPIPPIPTSVITREDNLLAGIFHVLHHLHEMEGYLSLLRMNLNEIGIFKLLPRERER